MHSKLQKKQWNRREHSPDREVPWNVFIYSILIKKKTKILKYQLWKLLCERGVFYRVVIITSALPARNSSDYIFDNRMGWLYGSSYNYFLSII